jgi:uncharacterized phage protein (TIGR02218 family)
MPNWIGQDLTTLAFCWRIERRDGIALGFTSHDRDIIIDGLTYQASPGLLPSAIERSDGFDADIVELAGALTSDAIREDDLAAGRWDGAKLQLSAVDWTAPDADPIHFVRGELGAVEISGERFSVELRGPTAILEAPVVEETSPDCRAALGDKRCRVDMADRTQNARVANTDGDQVILTTALADNHFAGGRMRWLDGGNAGLQARILANLGMIVTLADPPHFAVSAGTRVELTQGCDRRFQTCVSRFANAANFRGEPHLPGNDLLTRYAR